MVLTVLLALVFGVVEPQTLQTFDPNRIEDVRVTNNRRIPQDTIKYQLQTKAGDRLNHGRHTGRREKALCPGPLR